MANTIVNNLQNGTALLSLLGSFWNRLYGGSGLVGHIASARALTERQTFQNLMELVASTSRFGVPIYHRDNWRLFTFNESDMVHEAGGTFDIPVESLTDFADVKLMMNRIVEPSLTLSKGVDYDISDGYFNFQANPFTNPLLTITKIYDFDGEEIDNQATIWLFNGDFDWKLIYEQFGYVLSLHLESSENYRDLVNSIFDAAILGTARERIELMLSAITDVPLTIEPMETVEEIFTDRNHLVIATDYHVYLFNPEALPIVDVGQVVTGGSQLTNAFQIMEFVNGEIPDGLTAISLADGFLVGTTAGPLRWRDGTVPTKVDLLVSGKTKISWELGGDPTAVSTFWADTHTRGVAEGTTLANLLDTRTNPVGEPTAAHLPTSINPLQWLIENVLRYNAFAVLVRSWLVGEFNLGVEDPSALLRRIVPPHMAVFYQVLTVYSLEHDVNAILQKPTTKTHGVTAVLFDDIELAHGVTSVLFDTLELAHDADAILV